jgi:hypothetical protein
MVEAIYIVLALQVSVATLMLISKGIHVKDDTLS